MKARAFAIGLLPSLCFGAALLATACTRPSFAETFPSGTIRIIVGFGASSTADIVARVVGKYFGDEFGQSVVIENRPGNSSMLAAEQVARAPRDGLTLFMATVANTLNPVQTNSSFDLGRDLEPIALLGVSPNVLVIHPSIPAKTAKELMEIARTKPEILTFGTSGAGTASDFAARLFNIKAGSKVVIANYQGGANQSMTDLLTGRITASFNVAVAMAPQVNSGKLIALAVGQPHRATILPDVPTMEEQGIEGFDVSIWIGLLAPKGTPTSVIEKLAHAANSAMKTEAVQTALKSQGIDITSSSPQEFRKFIAADIEKWRSIVALSSDKKP